MKTSEPTPIPHPLPSDLFEWSEWKGFYRLKGTDFVVSFGDKIVPFYWLWVSDAYRGRHLYYMTCRAVDDEYEYEDLTFEKVLDSVPNEIREQLLFHLDLFA
jgi:hypothetical protein